MQRKSGPVTTAHASITALGENIFPSPLENIILEYADGDIDLKPSELQRYTLFSQDVFFLKANCQMTQAQALEASQNILLGKLDEVKKTIEKNRYVLYARVPEVYHPYPYPACNIDKKKDQKIILFKNKSILQIAAAIGSFNYTKNPPAHQGAVELICRYLPPAAITAQLSEQFPEGWKKTTEDRAKLYMSILKVFAKTIINTDDTEINNYALQQAKKDCKAMIDQFWFSLETLVADEACKTGFAFPLLLFNQAINFYLSQHKNFGLNINKRQLFWTIGIGGFQRLCFGDHPLFNHGLKNFFDDKQNGVSKNIKDLSNLGIDYYIHYSKQHTINAGNGFDLQMWQKYMDKMKSLYNNKISTLETLLSPQNNSALKSNPC